MVWRVRRVYTGHNKRGRAVIIEDGLAPNVKEMASMPGLALTDLWETTGPLARNEGNADAADRTVRLEPPGATARMPKRRSNRLVLDTPRISNRRTP